MALIIIWIVALGIAGASATVLAKMVRADGYGMRPAPRGVDEWTAHGLPSRPYGA